MGTEHYLQTRENAWKSQGFVPAAPGEENILELGRNWPAEAFPFGKQWGFCSNSSNQFWGVLHQNK